MHADIIQLTFGLSRQYTLHIGPTGLLGIKLQHGCLTWELDNR